ncbi:golgin subfamily A member 4-like isoform X1 [Osmia bicornis bicornis]|uniref:golgin subfamily A member 4-like isoform X1 n=1 Tax=Osmia bicornis bicornis TaxID=1437191 RepID=UPI001EAEF429|nr:golgin subfamily A member 4-like isoform X1 [Osmia bicornis bicornis]
MFKKFKDKLAEEMKQSPARLQASMQQLAQAVVSPALSSSSIQELSTSNDNFSLTEEGDETPKNSPAKHGFQNVDLMSSTPNSIGISRRSSVNSVTSDTSSLFPIYESPANLYHLQSDMDQSASEIDENISSQLDKITKDQIYSAYRKVQAKYHKYRGRYTDLATHYRELERVKGKLESVLVETQDKVLRRIADLKEQCQLEQQAKAHLEEALRNDIEEKDHIINTLNTKIKLLQTSSGPNSDVIMSGATNEDKGSEENLKDNLIDLNTESSVNSTENSLLIENTQLKDKLKKLENVVLKYKESLKRNKEKFTEVLTEKNTLESDYESLKYSYTEKEKELNNAHTEIRNLTDQMIILKKREEESVISLAENKLSIHRELEDKEEQIKKLQLELKHMTESKDNLNEIVNKYKTELEKLKLFHSTQNLDSEKKEIVHDVSKGKSETFKLTQQETQQKSISSEDKMDVIDHEENIKKTQIEDSEMNQSIKSKLDESKSELQKHTIEDLQKLIEEYQNNKIKLSMELSNCKLRYTELKNEQDAHKIIAEEKKKEADAMIEKLQATVQSLDKELENMRNALMDRDKVCENYNAKVNEYKMIVEETNEKILAQDTEIKTFKEKEQQANKLKIELENKVRELSETCNELQSCKTVMSDLKNKLQTYNSDIDLLREERNNLIKNILNYKISIQNLKTNNKRIKSDVTEHLTQFNNEMFALKNVLGVCLKEEAIIQNVETEDLQMKLKEFEEFKQKYDELQTELKDTICIKSDLQANLEKYNEQLKEMSINLEQQNEVDVKNRKLIAEIDNLNFKLYDLRNVSEEMNSLKIESKSLKEELNNVNTVNQLLSNEISELKIQFEEANNNKKELEETISMLKSESSNCNNKLEKQINSLQSEIILLKESMVEKDKQVNTLNEELRSKESFVNSLKNECEKHTKLIAKYEDQISKLKQGKETLQKTVQSMQDKLGKLKDIKQKQGLTIQELNGEINEVKIINTELLEKLKILENEINALKSENGQIITLQNSNSSITSELEQLKSIHHEIDLENKNLKDGQNELLKRNQELHESNEKLIQEVVFYEKRNEQLLNDNKQLQMEIESHKNSLSGQNQDIENLKSEIETLSTELESKTEKLNLQFEEFRLCKKEAEEIKEYFTKENKNLQNEICKLDIALKDRESIEEKNKELLDDVESLRKEIIRLKAIKEENDNLKLEINNLTEMKVNLEKMQLQYNELTNEYVFLKNNIAELEGVNSVNIKLQSTVNNLEAKISSLEQAESNNIELKTELDTLKTTNTEVLSQINKISVEREQLIAELGELKLTVDEKVAELKLLDNKNMELLKEIERLKSLTMEDEAIVEAETSRNTIEHMKEEIGRLHAEAEVLKKSNISLQEKVQNANTNKTVDDSFIKESDMLQEENKKLEAQLDEALITFQAKELQMQIMNNELKNQADKLKEELKTNEEEQSMRLKQLVKEFQAQLHDKEEELHAALEKRFDRQQNYESNLVQQYKEQLKDFQVELTTKSEQIENLILENKNLMAQKTKDINQLIEKVTSMKKEHADEMREIEKKWKSIVQQKTDKLEAKHEEEINELTREWRNERRPDVQNDLTPKELESTSRVAMAAVQSNTGSFHTLQQTLTAQRRELAELRKLVKLRHDTLEDSTEIEYLRNILFEYMMGRETMVLARVIAAVVKFDQEQTAKILKKEEDKMTLVKKFSKYMCYHFEYFNPKLLVISAWFFGSYIVKNPVYNLKRVSTFVY